MALVTGLKVEVEFVAGVWTDVTADVDFNQGGTIRLGRTSPQQACQASTLTLRFRNPTGKYTPGVAVLTDGTAAPYFPNVTRRKRIRQSNSAGVRFLGYIKTWIPDLDNGVAGYCTVQAADRLDQLARIQMSAGIASEVTADSPIGFWPLTDAAGSTTAASFIGGADLSDYGVGTPPVFGIPGPDTALTAALFASGQYLFGNIGNYGLSVDFSQPFSFECWVKLTTPVSAAGGLLQLCTSGTQRHGFVYDAAGHIEIQDSVGGGVGPVITDGQWHHVVGVIGGGNQTLYHNGTNLGTAGANDLTASAVAIVVGADFITGSGAASMSNVAVYNYALPAARITTHYLAGQQTGELVSSKVARFLTYANVPLSEQNIDVSTVPTSPYPQSNVAILNGCQDMSTTEGGGSVFYFQPSISQLRWTNRNFRAPAAPTLTIDADLDLDNSAYQPSLDDQNLVNQVTVSRSSAGSGQSTQVANNPTSIASEGLFTGPQITTYTTTDQDALNLAQDIVARGSIAEVRFGQVSVDLNTSTNNLVTSVQNTVIGSRLRVTNMPPGAPGGSSQIDVLVEGWTETFNFRQYKIVFDTSPADAPARAVWSGTNGIWQPQSLFLANAITSGSASLVVTSSRTNLVTNPSFETNTTGWSGAAAGYTTATIARSTTRAYNPPGYGQTASLLVTWPTTAAGVTCVRWSATGLTIGLTYEFSLYVWVPYGSPAVQILEVFSNRGTTSTVVNQWQRLSMSKVAAATSYNFGITMPAATPTTAGQTVYVDCALLEQTTSLNSYIEGTVGSSQPMFTTNGGNYPISIILDAEVISLGAAPGGATSPQTFSTLSRAQAGTTAAAHAAGTPVNLYPTGTWQL